MENRGRFCLSFGIAWAIVVPLTTVLFTLSDFLITYHVASGLSVLLIMIVGGCASFFFVCGELRRLIPSIPPSITARMTFDYMAVYGLIAVATNVLLYLLRPQIVSLDQTSREWFYGGGLALVWSAIGAFSALSIVQGLRRIDVLTGDDLLPLVLGWGALHLFGVALIPIVFIAAIILYYLIWCVLPIYAGAIGALCGWLLLRRVQPKLKRKAHDEQ